MSQLTWGPAAIVALVLGLLALSYGVPPAYCLVVVVVAAPVLALLTNVGYERR